MAGGGILFLRKGALYISLRHCDVDERGGESVCEPRTFRYITAESIVKVVLSSSGVCWKGTPDLTR
jgi:hypothetical protein